jgi:hypothetical protein
MGLSCSDSASLRIYSGPLDIHVLVLSPGNDVIFTCCFAARALGFRLLAAAWESSSLGGSQHDPQEDPSNTPKESLQNRKPRSVREFWLARREGYL